MSPDPVPITPAATKANDALGEIIQVATDAKPPAVPSPPASFKGWLFGVWFVKNKSKLKTIVTAASGIATAWVSVHLLGAWGVVAGGGVSLVTQFVLDAIDFYFTKNAS